MAVFRYVGYLFGIPDEIQYENRKDAKEIFRIGLLCEPPPDDDSAVVANELVRAVPRVTDVQTAEEAEEQMKLGYALSRVLLGRKTAKDLQFPKYNGFMSPSFYFGPESCLRACSRMPNLSRERILQNCWGSPPMMNS